MPCPICGATCVCRKRGADGRCCPCHKHKSRTPAQAQAHAQYDAEQKDRSATASAGTVDLLAELGTLDDAVVLPRYTYPGLFERPVETDLLIIRRGQGRVPVVIATERDDNPGASITNTIERLAAQLADEQGWNWKDFLLFEHYPPRLYDLGRSLDHVTFAHPWATPTWTHATLEQVRALIARPALV